MSVSTGGLTALLRRSSVTAAADDTAVRVVAWIRLAVLVGLAASGSFRHGLSSRESALYLLLGLVWVPWSCVVLLAADRPDRRVALVGGPVADVAALALAQVLVPGTTHATLFGYLVVVAFAGMTASRATTISLAAATFGIVTAADGLAGNDARLRAGDVVAFGAALVGMLLLTRRTATGQALATARVEGLRTKADVILASVVGGVVVTDSAGTVLQANPAAERILGAPPHGVAGRSCVDALGLRIDATALDCSAGCGLLRLEGREAGQAQEVWRLSATSEKQPILASAVTLYTADGVEVVHSLQDITRLKQAEEAKTLFLATASHELKTPLTVISGFAATLHRFPDLDDETKTQGLVAISTRAQELSRIVDRLLLSSRIESGRVSLKTTQVALPPILRDRVETLAQATSRTITCTVDDDLPTVQAEPGALATVIDHLLDNALKYSPDGGEVRVSASGDESGAVVAVADQGVGMDPDQAEHCFDKFWQAESTDVRRFGGTGIGLYIVRSLVEAMGGRITVSSAPGAGTTFSVHLSGTPTIPTQRPGAALGEPTSIREFMRQIGVPDRGPT